MSTRSTPGTRFSFSTPPPAKPSQAAPSTALTHPNIATTVTAQQSLQYPDTHTAISVPITSSPLASVLSALNNLRTNSSVSSGTYDLAYTAVTSAIKTPVAATIASDTLGAAGPINFAFPNASGNPKKIFPPKSFETIPEGEPRTPTGDGSYLWDPTFDAFHTNPKFRPGKQNREQIAMLTARAEAQQEYIKNLQDEIARREQVAAATAVQTAARSEFQRRHPAINNNNARPPLNNPEMRVRAPCPIGMWKISFDGTPATMPVEDFVFRLEVLMESDNVSEDYLARHFHRLVTGKADRWFWQLRRRFMRPDWPTIRTALYNQYRGLTTDRNITRDMLNKRQGYKESFDDYFTDILSMNSRLNNPLPDDELIDIMRQNVNTKISSLIFNDQFYSLDEFRNVCMLAEIHPSNAYPPPRNIHELEQNITENQNELLEAYEKPVAQVKTPTNNKSTWKCWNCDHLGHGFRECLSQFRGIFCFSCGYKGVIKAHCPRCMQGNLMQPAKSTGDSRHPMMNPATKP